MNGRSNDRPELAQKKIPLEVKLPAVACRGGERLLRSLFEPLGYTVVAIRVPLDDAFPVWGASPYFSVTLSVTTRLSDLLSHLYVLIPVLDDAKHYWVAEEEVEKLLRHGGNWLATHPEREQISRRYLKYQKSLSRIALERLVPHEEGDDPEDCGLAGSKAIEREAALEERLSLNQQRIQAVLGEIKTLGAQSVVDLGCGEGKLLAPMLKERSITRLVGMDVSIKSLEHAAERLNFERLPTAVRNKIELLHGSLTYRDKRLGGFDVATVIEVIEHLDQRRLVAFERVLFEFARPKVVIVTTPNAEYNVKFESLPAGKFRHADHRFEWSRLEFENWSAKVCASFGYAARFQSVGPEDAELGAPTQMGIFERIGA